MSEAERDPTPEELAGDADERAAIMGLRPRRQFTALSIKELTTPPEPVRYLLEALDICPGRPTLFAGYGFAGKTIALQSLAVSVAAGGRAWGQFQIGQRGVVVHLDYEQGRRLTVLRYWRLAAAHGIGMAALAPSLRIATLPRILFTHPDAEEAVTAFCAGAKLLIVDSLAASTPGAKENDPAIAEHLRMLQRVSETTGVCAIMVHHMGKPPGDSKSGRTAAHSIRGSAAIFDACNSVVVLARNEEHGGIDLQHLKASTSGKPNDAVLLRVSDVELHGARFGGLRVTAEASTPASEAVELGGRPGDDLARVLSWVRAESLAGRPVPGVDACARGAGLGMARGRRATRVLLEREKLLDRPTRSSSHGRLSPRIWLAELAPVHCSTEPTLREYGSSVEQRGLLDRSSSGRAAVEQVEQDATRRKDK